MQLVDSLYSFGTIEILLHGCVCEGQKSSIETKKKKKIKTNATDQSQTKTNNIIQDKDGWTTRTQQE